MQRSKISNHYSKSPEFCTTLKFARKFNCNITYNSVRDDEVLIGDGMEEERDFFVWSEFLNLSTWVSGDRLSRLVKY